MLPEGHVACPGCGVGFPDRRGRVTCGARACQRQKERAARGTVAQGDIPERQCAACEKSFQPLNRLQVTCGEKRCKNRRAEQRRVGRERARTPASAATAAFVTEAPKEPEVRTMMQPEIDESLWFEPPPDLGAKHLPGAALPIAFAPFRRASLREASIIHALVTRSLGGHQAAPVERDFALICSDLAPSGWGVYVSSDEAVSLLRREARTFPFVNRPVTVTFGAPVRLRVPAAVGASDGASLVRVDTVTPVVVRSTAKGPLSIRKTYTKATSRCVWVCLTAVAKRLGIDVDPERIAVEVVEVQTDHQVARVGKKLDGHGRLESWDGWFVARVNPLARWLLDVAALTGFGGRTAYGFGRIRVRGTTVAEEHGGEAPEVQDELLGPVAIRRAAEIWGVTEEVATARLMECCSRATFVGEAREGTELWQGGDLTFVVLKGPLGVPYVSTIAWAGEPVRMAG